MDFQIKSSIGRMFTASTNQLDLYMGKRFGLEYIDKDGQKKTPAVIHRAPLGTHERFIGFLIEHFAGNFPLWLSPVQAALLPISEKQHDYIQKVAAQIKSNLPDLRLEIDDRNESIGKRIREATKQKVPYILVAGDKEIESNSLAVRKLDGTDLGAIPVEELIKKLSEEINEKK
jgi:threonyl-tRNA synthetase